MAANNTSTQDLEAVIWRHPALLRDHRRRHAAAEGPVDRALELQLAPTPERELEMIEARAPSHGIPKSKPGSTRD